MRPGTRSDRRSVESYVLSFFESPLALMLAYAVMLAVAWAGCRVAVNRCVDLSGLPWYLGGAVAGIVLAVFYWVRAFRLGDSVRRRLLLDAIVLALALAPYVIAWTYDRLEESRRPPFKSQANPSLTR